jgi:hypothetical protein
MAFVKLESMSAVPRTEGITNALQPSDLILRRLQRDRLEGGSSALWRRPPFETLRSSG